MNKITREDNQPAHLMPGRALAAVLALAVMAALVVGCATPQLRVESAVASLESAETGFLPALFGSPEDRVTPTPEATATVTPTPTPDPTGSVTPLPPPLPAPTTIVSVPPIDFDAARADAQSKGLDLAFVKIGFHVARWQCHRTGRLGAQAERRRCAILPEERGFRWAAFRGRNN